MASSNGDFSRPAEVSPALPDPALPDADWADAFEVVTQNTSLSIMEIAERTVGTTPAWSIHLMQLRNLVVAPFGLKTEEKNGVSITGKRVGIFPVLEKAPDRLVLGMDDKHLDFRIVLSREIEQTNQRIRATTLVLRHNAFGKLYITLITPFHRMIVSATLNQLAD